MKYLLLKVLSFTLLILCTTLSSCGQQAQNWTAKELMQPALLSNIIKSKKDIPYIINIGPGAVIPHSIDVGMVNTESGFNKLKSSLSKIPRDKKTVIYCGCCPYKHCPNVRPAIDLLKSMQFTNYYLLDLPQNIRVDWINKGYPVI